ncbi:unnamed protein product [Calypogeia fissa]
MGIQGLLPALKSIITPVHVRSYAGKKAAIDTYAWLHKAAYSCSKELCEGHPTDKLIDYCMHRINLLRHHGVQPVMVFDGGVLPMKADQEEKRARSRKEHLERALDHERTGNRSAAYESYQKAVDITPAMASRLIKVLKKEGVHYIVAPYEADAQMAFLAIHGHVDVIITEDSDLIAYGCPRIFFKMDKYGQGEQFQYDDIGRNKDIKFVHFTPQMVLEMCVMTGCDYLPSLPGMGVKKAFALIQRFRSYRKVIRHLRFSGTTISAQYEETFEKALLTFHHQRVYDPVSQRMVHLTDVPDDNLLSSSMSLTVNTDLPQELVKAIAVGDVDPSTYLPFEEAEPALPNYGNTSYQFVAKKPVEMPAQKNVVTNYFFSESGEAKKQFKAPKTEFCSEKQGENRPTKYTSGSLVPETGDLASTPEAEVFGTPLPDNEEDGLSGVKEVQSKVPGFELQEKSRRSTGVLQDSISPAVSHRFPFESATSTDLCATFSGKDRKKSTVDAPPVRRSSYFSPRQPLRNESSEQSNGDSPSVIETELKDVDSCGIAVTKKSRIDVREVVFKKQDEAGPLGQESRLPGQGFDKFIHTTPNSSCSFENRNSLSSISPVPREGGSSEVGKFCTNVSHVAQFANIAQKSVDKFAETIESFRWSYKGGARASGLRAPLATISTNTTTRIATKGLSTLGGNLNKFAYQPSTFKPPSRKTAP